MKNNIFEFIFVTYIYKYLCGNHPQNCFISFYFVANVAFDTEIFFTVLDITSRP